MVFKENTLRQRWKIEKKKMLSISIICGKGNLFLLKSCVFSVYVLLLVYLALK